MIIKKISEECVKVLIESEDINRYNIPYHKLSSSDEDSVEFIYRLLFVISEQTGVNLLESAISVEASPACGGNYFLTLSRKNEESEGMSLRKEGQPQSDMFIFALESAEDLHGVIDVLKQHKCFIPKRCSLYRLTGRYYIIMDFPAEQTEHKDFDKMMRHLGEYLLPLRATPESEGYLCERGELICPALILK